MRRRLPHPQAQVERGERIARCPSCSLTIRLIHPDDAPNLAIGDLPQAAGAQPQTAAGGAAGDSSLGPPVLHVNAFTLDPFGGNPAAVCLLPAPADDGWMQGVAANMNLSDTAFVTPTGDTQASGVAGSPAAGETFSLRWFTPTIEVELCGHATLAAAHVLFSLHGGRSSPTLRFSTLSGELLARRLPDHTIELDFPSRPAQPLRDALPSLSTVASALRLDPSVIELVGGALDLLVLLQKETTVRALAPDMRALARLPHRGIIVTAPGDGAADELTDVTADDRSDETTAIHLTGRVDFVSRFFAPGVGIDEDPVTGSAHCTLAPFWSARLGGRRRMRARQLSPRGGELEVELNMDSPKGERVWVRGHAVTTLEGRLVGRGPPPPGEG